MVYNTYLLPGGDLLIVIDPRGVGQPSRLRSNERRLGYEESSGKARPLSVVLEAEVGRDVGGVVAVTSQGSVDNTMTKRHLANLDRLE